MDSYTTHLISSSHSIPTIVYPYPVIILVLWWQHKAIPAWFEISKPVNYAIPAYDGHVFSFNHHNGQVVEPFLPHSAPKPCVKAAQGTEGSLTATAADWNSQSSLNYSS